MKFIGATVNILDSVWPVLKSMYGMHVPWAYLTPSSHRAHDCVPIHAPKQGPDKEIKID